MPISRRKPNAIELLNYKDTSYSDFTYIRDSRLINDNGEAIIVDELSRSLAIIDVHASLLHDGKAFYMKGFLELDNTDDYYIKLVTPVDKELHFNFVIKSTGITTSYFDEGATGGMTGGTPVIPINRNRNSSITSEAVLTAGVTTATSYDKRIDSDKWGSTGFKLTVGGSGEIVSDWVLKKNTTYLRSFISGADNNIIQFQASWSEIESKA